MSGFTGQSTEVLTATLVRQRAGLDALLAMGDAALVGNPKEKESPPIMGGVITMWLMQDIEAELIARGVDPASAPGTPWVSIMLAEVEELVA